MGVLHTAQDNGHTITVASVPINSHTMKVCVIIGGMAKLCDYNVGSVINAIYQVMGWVPTDEYIEGLVEEWSPDPIFDTMIGGYYFTVMVNSDGGYELHMFSLDGESTYQSFDWTDSVAGLVASLDPQIKLNSALDIDAYDSLSQFIDSLFDTF